MNEATRRVPSWFWIVAGLALLWEAFGCAIYLMQTLTPEAAREGGYATMASWQWGVFAVAVWSGLLGAIGLLLRRRWATLALAVSLVFALVQYGYEVARGTLPADAAPIAATVVIVGVLLVVFASIAGRRGWLG